MSSQSFFRPTRHHIYEEKLKELALPSLHDRRLETDMVQTFKIVNGIDSEESEQWFERANTRRTTRNTAGEFNLLPKRCNHEYRRDFFSQRVIERWNVLPTVVKAAPTVSQFKRLYRRHLEGIVAPANAESWRDRAHLQRHRVTPSSSESYWDQRGSSHKTRKMRTGSQTSFIRIQKFDPIWNQIRAGSHGYIEEKKLPK